MSKQKVKLNVEVTRFLDELNHPFRKEIEQLRQYILSADSGLEENIKWNGPNYTHEQKDRVTMRIQPPKQIQLIFHRGAKVQIQPKEKLIKDASGLLLWKENDRAVATFKNMGEIDQRKQDLTKIVKEWIAATEI
ncbi:MAG: DUF1801 domain-containing protein [Bacteroidota bacterium]|nr:DUF1801 domain-containing protein [Bacteroidota bacterium]